MTLNGVIVIILRYAYITKLGSFGGQLRQSCFQQYMTYCNIVSDY